MAKCLAREHKRRDRPGRDSNTHSDNARTSVQCTRPLGHGTLGFCFFLQTWYLVTSLCSHEYYNIALTSSWQNKPKEVCRGVAKEFPWGVWKPLCRLTSVANIFVVNFTDTIIWPDTMYFVPSPNLFNFFVYNLWIRSTGGGEGGLNCQRKPQLSSVLRNICSRQTHSSRFADCNFFSGSTFVLVPLMLHLPTEALNADWENHWRRNTPNCHSPPPLRLLRN